MKNSEKKLGVSLWVLGMLMSGEAAAQTCVIPPTCEELGYDKVASDCGSLAKLKCPFDDSKYFCTAYTDSNGAKIAEIGDIVYTDAISAEPLSGRIPVGIVYDLSGKMLSLDQFSGTSTQTSQCASYTTDGVGGWSLPGLEDMALIKTNVAKINSQLAKFSVSYQINTKRTDLMKYSTALLWRTTTQEACMNEEYIITADTTYGCDRDRVLSSSALRFLCVRSFGSGGAGNDPARTTYAVGDTYVDKDGKALGTVFEVDSGGQHGMIITRTSRSGTQSQAIEYCDSLNASTGLIWGLPTWNQMVTVCSNNISGYSTSSTYWTADGNKGQINDPNFSHPYSCGKANIQLSPDRSYSYFCAAAF